MKKCPIFGATCSTLIFNQSTGNTTYGRLLLFTLNYRYCTQHEPSFICGYFSARHIFPYSIISFSYKKCLLGHQIMAIC